MNRPHFLITLRSLGLAALLSLVSSTDRAFAQVHYHPDGRPWTQRAHQGPDAEVPGWFINLGITGIRIQLTEEEPTSLLVKYVFESSPAAGKVIAGDRIVGANGLPFTTPHRNGYGMEVFGAAGPVFDFARALDASQGTNWNGQLHLKLLRGDEIQSVVLEVGTRYGRYGGNYPIDCSKSDLVFSELCEFLAKTQKEDGSWGSPPHDTFAPLALLASEDPRYQSVIEKSVRMHARTTKSKDSSWLINWRYMSAGIVLSEYFLATGEEWVLPELREIRDFLLWSQYVDPKQIVEKTKIDRPEDLPKKKGDAEGGWGHNPGFEGYGPICMITGQGALAFSLMQRCGIEIDRKRHDLAYNFLARGTGPNGYVWYGDQIAGPNDWADHGRTGAAGIAYALSPYPEEVYRTIALAHSQMIGDHPESFPDTHGSPVMGMGYSALAAFVEPTNFRKLLDANRWWFTLSQCTDGTFYYAPNRDNAGYGSDSRVSASAVVAFILAIPKQTLAVTGKRN